MIVEATRNCFPMQISLIISRIENKSMKDVLYLIKTGSSDLRTICPCSSFFSVELVNRQSVITSLIAFVVFGGLSKLALNGNQMHFYVDEELLSAQKVSPQFFLPFNVSDGRDI